MFSSIGLGKWFLNPAHFIGYYVDMVWIWENPNYEHPYLQSIKVATVCQLMTELAFYKHLSKGLNQCFQTWESIKLIKSP